VTQRIVLIGLSGAGKSTVARLLGARLGWAVSDTDAEIAGRFGQTIAEIFQDHGESAFRSVERELLFGAVRQERIVVATGGGAVVADDVWSDNALSHPDTLVVALEVSPAVALDRLREQQAADGAASERPLLAVSDPLQRLKLLKSSRQAIYDRAAITLIVDLASPETIAAEIAALLDQGADRVPDVTLTATSGTSAIHISPGVSTSLGGLARARWPTSRRAWLISDDRVGPLHRDAIGAALIDAGFMVTAKDVAAGERSKSLATTGELLDWLLKGGVERSDVVVALGGGVVGDLAGFVAATCLRGLPLIQMPTSILAMVDSSVGGKTGINHPTGKNLIGAFYQPPLVVIDPNLLSTMSRRELASGWGEIVKHAVIQPSTPNGKRGDLLAFLERNAERLLRLDPAAITYAIRRNVALKAAVVEADEREAGMRAFLNFGHTLGHAIEAAGYQHLHGEAIAIGMRAAAAIGTVMGTCDAATGERLAALSENFGLPIHTGADPDRVMVLIQSDKKKFAGTLRWVLPLRDGGVTLRADVPLEVVRTALDSVTVRP